MEQFDGPLAPVPSWLDPADEITDQQPHTFKDRGEFSRWCIDQLLVLGIVLHRAIELAAHFALETGFGGADRHAGFRGWNLGGVKAYPAWARAERAAGRRPRFYRAHGNVGTGDSQTVIYMAYDGPTGFFVWWIERFLPKPKPGVAVVSGRAGNYTATGAAFWSDDDWFAEILKACYRGSVTRAHPQGSIDAQHQLVHTIRLRWAQSRLGVVADGAWGPKSRAACMAFQAAHPLPATGTLDDATLAALAGVQ
jgi:peptidoglycan hydrolase-like protein with peptidoglycan-binding domain